MPSTRILIRNASGQTLHHVTAEVKFANDLGETKSWYAYLPALEPLQYILTEANNSFYGIDGHSAKIEATASVFCSEGSTVGSKVVSVPDEKFARWQSAHLDGAESREEIQSLRVRLASAVATAKQAAWPDAPKVLRLLTELYGTPRNPELMLARLASKIEPGKRYCPAHSIKDMVSITFEPFDARPNSISAVVTLLEEAPPDGRRKSVDHKMMGRCVEELERGFVIALVRGEPRVPPISSFQRLKEDRDGRAKRSLQMWRESAARYFQVEKQGWDSGLTIALTSPLEIASRDLPQVDPRNVISPKIRKQIEDTRDRAKRSVAAKYVVFVDSKDQLSIQYHLGGQDLSFAPLLLMAEK